MDNGASSTNSPQIYGLPVKRQREKACFLPNIPTFPSESLTFLKILLFFAPFLDEFSLPLQ
jgi:hypothetical protein